MSVEKKTDPIERFYLKQRPLRELTAEDNGRRGAHYSEKARIHGAGVAASVAHSERLR